MAYALIASVTSAAANTHTSGAIDTTGANRLLVAISDDSGAGTLSDSKSNTYTLDKQSTDTGPRVRIYRCDSPTVGSGHTFTLTGSAVYGVLMATAWSGADTGSGMDQSNQASSAATTLAVGSVTPTVDNELLLYAAGCGPTVNSVDIGTLLLSVPGVGGVNYGGGLGYQIQTTATARNPTFTMSGSGNNRGAIATYKASAGGGADSVTGNPITWQWEQNSSSVRESLNSSPTDWAWFVQTGVLVESVQASPTAWEWATTTGDIVEGSQDILTTTPINWEWAQGSVSFVDKLEGSPVSWEWAVTTGTQTENLETNPVAWEWTTSNGELLGTTAVDTNPISWEWEVTTGFLVQIIPEVGGTIGGKPNKQVNWPFYEGKDYESRIDLEETQPRTKRVDDSKLDVRALDKPNDSRRIDARTSDVDGLDTKPNEQGDRLVSDLLQELKGEVSQVSVTERVLEFPNISESEGFDENDSSVEAAVIMLLLAA